MGSNLRCRQCNEIDAEAIYKSRCAKCIVEYADRSVEEANKLYESFSSEAYKNRRLQEQLNQTQHELIIAENTNAGLEFRVTRLSETIEDLERESK